MIIKRCETRFEVGRGAVQLPYGQRRHRITDHQRGGRIPLAGQRRIGVHHQLITAKAQTRRQQQRGQRTDPADAAVLDGIDGLRVVEHRGNVIIVEAPRYRALTLLLIQMAGRGIDQAEIAGNDDIMFTALSDQAPAPDW